MARKQLILVAVVVVSLACACDGRNRAVVATQQATKGISWPDLSEFPSYRNKNATQEEVKSGKAAFALRSPGGQKGKPLDVELPQYAIHVDKENGRRTPGVLIQVEEIDGIRIAGFVVLPDRSPFVATFEEFELLGSKRP